MEKRGNDYSDVGPDKTYKTPNEKHDAQQGTYKSPVTAPLPDLLPQTQLPLAPGPQPFKDRTPSK